MVITGLGIGIGVNIPFTAVQVVLRSVEWETTLQFANVISENDLAVGNGMFW